MKEQINKAKKFVADHKYEVTIGLIAACAVGALIAVKSMNDTNDVIDTTAVDAIDEGPDNEDTSIEE